MRGFIVFITAISAFLAMMVGSLFIVLVYIEITRGEVADWPRNLLIGSLAIIHTLIPLYALHGVLRRDPPRFYFAIVTALISLLVSVTAFLSIPQILGLATI